jgi:hypothetical protein
VWADLYKSFDANVHDAYGIGHRKENGGRDCGDTCFRESQMVTSTFIDDRRSARRLAERHELAIRNACYKTRNGVRPPFLTNAAQTFLDKVTPNPSPPALFPLLLHPVLAEGHCDMQVLVFMRDK